MEYLDRMVNNFKINNQVFKNGDIVKLSNLSNQWDDVKFERLQDNVEYIISSNYFSKHLEPQQWISIEGSNFYYPSWCFILY